MIFALPAPPVWQPPLPPPARIVRPFAPPAAPWLPGHRGVDLSTHPGAPVHASGDGRIAFARDLAGRGVITITHGSLRTTYEPVLPSLPTGTWVTSGTQIGTVQPARSHCFPTTCLHWGLRQGNTYLNPLPPRIRLLPHWPTP